MLWEERTGPLYKQLEHHYDAPELWVAALAEHRAVLKAIAAHDPGRRARRDAASSESGVQAFQHRLGRLSLDAGANHAYLPHSRQGRPSHRGRRRTARSRPGQVLIRLGAGGICGSDLHYYFEGRNGSFVVREPLIPGHEASGVVAKIGPGVTRVKVGDKIAVSPSHACGHCDYCREGREHLCRNMRFLGSASLYPHVQGMFCEYFVMGERQCYPVVGRRHPGRARLCRAAGGRLARGQPRRRPARQDRC